MARSYTYKAFGLNIASTFEIPELPAGDFNEADVQIKYGENPEKLAQVTDRGVLYQAKKNDFLFRLDTVGSYRVLNGSTITIQKLNNATDEEVRLFLLGSALGALIHQRGILPLHGTTILHQNRAIIICGTSGAGKSSLAAILKKRGFEVLADDITAVNTSDKLALAYPGIPHLKIWEDVLKKLNEDPSEYQRIRPQLQKYRVYADEVSALEPAPIKSIVILTSRNEEKFSIEEIKGAEKFNVLKNNTYRHQFISALEMSAAHFKLASQLASMAAVFRITRPNAPLMLEEMADFFVKQVIDR